MRTRGFGSVAWMLLALLGCEPKHGSNTPDAGGKGKSTGASCASNAGVGRQLVADYRQARSAGGELASARASLRESCEAGCGATCLEYAHTSADRREAIEFWRHACAANEAAGCSYAGKAEAGAATQLCEAGEALACATVLALEPESAGDSGKWQALSAAASAACKANDGRGCSTQAWARCAVEDRCDAEATELAMHAATLLPNPEIIEALAIVQCRAGQADAANRTLADACTSGTADACQRSCESMRGQAVLVRADLRERFDSILLYMALNLDVAPNWYTVLSAMDAEQLAGFEQMLDKFIPPVTEAGAKASVPAGLREQAPELVEAILRSPQVDAKKIIYWFKRLPDMPEEQRTNLLESLRKQWWIIPGDPGQTPQSFVDGVRLRSGGLSPAWLSE